MPQSSLLITSNPTDPLPLYTRHPAPDPETSSIRSSAPSYTSAAPSYYSSAPRHGHSRPTTNATPRVTPTSPTAAAQPGGLPSSSRYAPGFRNRAHSAASSRDLLNRNLDALYNINEWSPIQDSLQSRPYQNVANRRATVASENLALSAAMTIGMSSPIRSLIPRDTPGERHTSSSSTTFLTSPSFSNVLPLPPMINTMVPNPIEEEDSDHLSPLEDPHLVGEVAAARAKASRIYMAKELAAARKIQAEDIMLRQEIRTWDFMIAQMTDWEERERSWKNFRTEVGRTKLLGKRLGLRGR